MQSETIEQPITLWSHLLAAAEEGASGALRPVGAGYACLLGGGKVAGIDGEPSQAVAMQAFADAGVIPFKTAQRARAIAKTARTEVVRVLQDLGVVQDLSGEDISRIETAGALGYAASLEGPWEWTPDAAGAGGLAVDLVPAMVQALAHHADTKELVAWAGRPDGLRPGKTGGAAWEQVPDNWQHFLQSVTPEASARELLADAPGPAREALVWLAVGLKLGWISGPSSHPGVALVGGATAAASEEVEADEAETAELVEELAEVEADQAAAAAEAADAEELLVLEDELDVEVDDEGMLLGGDAEELAADEDQPTFLDGEEFATDAAEPEELEEPVVLEEEPEPAPEPKPEPKSEPKQEAKQKPAANQQKSVPFFLKPLPHSLYARLGVPEGAAGQAIAQSYSKRFRHVQKAAQQKPGDERIEAWKEGLLEAYRILNHSEAANLYEQWSAQGAAPDLAQRVVQEMGKRALARGVKELRSGNQFEGAKSLQEALSWQPKMPEAWIAMGFFQASLDDEEETISALESFQEAANHAPDNPDVRYHLAVTAWFAGDREAFAGAKEWLEAHPDAAPAAWDAFCQETGAA